MGVISTIQARCKDCYRCLRSCPVKAISIKAGEKRGELHAQVVDELCVACGTCVRECPQKAKRVREDLPLVIKLLAAGEKLSASVAPSFAAGLPLLHPLQLVTALKRLGFDTVEETAIGAEMVAEAHKVIAESGSDMVLSTACPTIVNLVEKHFPSVIKNLSPIVSPMMAHARSLRQRYPDHKVVFIGPCFAKKAEASDEENQDIAAAITFAEMMAWLNESGMDVNTLPETPFDGKDAGRARLFPIDGGLSHTASFNTEPGATETRMISGMDDCIEFLKMLSEQSPALKDVKVVELLSCRGGCTNGPGVVSDCDQFTRKARLVEYAKCRAMEAQKSADDAVQTVDLVRTFTDRQPKRREPSEAEIRAILLKTGKETADDELNCGACGYGSCVEKARAVYHGLADIEMCIPFMRRKAESLSNSVVDWSPTAIVVVDRDCRVVQVNNSFEKAFSTPAKDIVTHHLSEFIPSDAYQTVIRTGRTHRFSMSYSKYGIVTRQTVFSIPGENLVCGLITDITDEERRRGETEKLKASTMERAQEVIIKQMKVAQEIAGLLGETTAETKVLLSKIIEINRED